MEHYEIGMGSRTEEERDKNCGHRERMREQRGEAERKRTGRTVMEKGQGAAQRTNLKGKEGNGAGQR